MKWGNSSLRLALTLGWFLSSQSALLLTTFLLNRKRGGQQFFVMVVLYLLISPHCSLEDKFWMPELYDCIKVLRF